jgi:predicted transposase YbfD/YdcC
MNLLDAFSDLPDPRLDRQKQHKLIDIIAITFCATLSGMDNFVDVEFYAQEKEAFLRQFLELPNGIPSHDTFNRVWSLIDPKEFELRSQRWLQSLQDVFSVPNGVVAIDGKTMRGSAQPKRGIKGLHQVTAYATSLGVTLGSCAVNDKSNEITAIPELLETLYIKGCLVTIDAMGCQTAIAEKILENKADYLLALKGNQGNLHDDVVVFFDKNVRENSDLFSATETIDAGHGRIDIRRCWVANDIDWLTARHPQWPSLTSIVAIESERHIDDNVSVHRRYYISSRAADAPSFLQAVRQHWAIENNLHWVLDVVFNEDAHQLRDRHAAQNLNVLRKMAIPLLKNAEGPKKNTSMSNKRKLCSWDELYLLKVMGVKLN